MARSSSRLTTSYFRSIDSRLMQRELTAGDTQIFVHGCLVPLDWTSCTYGGYRAWFLCPDCGRRAALLYLVGPGNVSCRHCLNLDYDSQRESKEDRAIRRYNKIRRRLGWKPGFLNGEGGKPRAMHWRIFWLLRAQHAVAAFESVAGYATRRGLMPPGL